MGTIYIDGWPCITSKGQEPCGKCVACEATKLKADVKRLTKERDVMKAVVDSLPVTADGVPIVPGQKVFYITTRDAGKSWSVSEHRVSEICDIHGDPSLVLDPEDGLIKGMKPLKLWHSTKGHNRFFSTREAAVAIKEKGK